MRNEVNAQTINEQTVPRRFDAPILASTDTLRAVTRHDATAERRRFDLGFQEGREAGYLAGQAEVDAAIADHRSSAERLSALCEALEQALSQTRQHEQDSIANIEQTVIEMSMEIAESIVHREITDHSAVIDVIAHCLQLHRSENPTARVHPDDLKCAQDARRAGLIGGVTAFELVADPAVQRGGCVLDAGSSRFDAQLAPAVQRVRTALSGPDSQRKPVGDLLADSGKSAQFRT